MDFAPPSLWEKRQTSAPYGQSWLQPWNNKTIETSSQSRNVFIGPKIEIFSGARCYFFCNRTLVSFRIHYSETLFYDHLSFVAINYGTNDNVAFSHTKKKPPTFSCAQLSDFRTATIWSSVSECCLVSCLMILTGLLICLILIRPCRLFLARTLKTLN